jgi:uncharacterized protein YyaL (SSP411 family)
VRLGATVALVVAAVGPAGAGDAAPEGLANRLGAEPSEYLRSAGESPVAWQPWSEAAWRLARDLDRPILLSIGADWCHWCHVMDRETYADPGIAAFINAHFVPIKVDRDDRPDVDARYQEAARLALDTAGWPLTLFLTSSGGLVSGGATFFPEEHGGAPGLRALLPRVVALVRERGEDTGAAVVTARRLVQAGGPSPRPAQLSPRLAAEVLDVTLGQFDVIHGGFGHRAKHVPAAILTLVARRHAETGAGRLRDVLTRTLDGMAMGAIRDHLGGGFFRSTTDRAWRAPRFERLEVIQAQVIVAYLLGYQATGAARYRALAEDALAYVDRVLARRGGGFSAGQRADAAHFLWSEADVRAALPAAEADLLVRHFGLAGATARRPLAVDVAAESLAAESGVSLGAIERRLRAAKDRLRQARVARGEPALDDTVYADRSALLASAYLEAYKVLGGEERLRVALDTLAFLWARMREPDGGMAHAFRDGGVIARGLLDDQFATAGAFLDAFEVTGVARYLDSARALVTQAVARFRAADGGFADAPTGPGNPAALRQRFVDDDWPGGNALAALVLERLHALTNEPAYRTLARDALLAMPPSADRPGPRIAGYAFAADVHVNGAVHVVIAGKTSDARTRALWRGALRAFRPGKTVAGYDPDGSDLASVPAPVAAVLRQQPDTAEPRAYVCSGTVCSLPQSDAERLRELVEGLGRRP